MEDHASQSVEANGTVEDPPPAQGPQVAFQDGSASESLLESTADSGQSQKRPPPPPSPLTGCYLLIVIGEPHSERHKEIILQKISKGFLSWDVNECHVSLEKELQSITVQSPEGEEARYGERLIQYATENLVTEILIHPQLNTLHQCMKNLLSSFTKHRHIIHAGYTFAGNGSWILQDGTLSISDLVEALHEAEVLRVLKAYENSVTVDVHCAPEGDWTTDRFQREPVSKLCKIRVNPGDVMTAGDPAISAFIDYLSPFLEPANIQQLLQPTDVVGNIRFTHPTLYVFPGGQGDAALFGINGFNMLVDGGFSRKACFWDFARHLDRLDAVLLTRLNNSTVNGISAVLQRKKMNHVYPQIGHFFCNLQDRKIALSPDGDKDKDSLIVNLAEEGQEIVANLKHLALKPHPCYRDGNQVDPVNLYHKVGHGKLDMYVISPARDSQAVKEFLSKWSANDNQLFSNTGKKMAGKGFDFPIQNLVSICALLVWQPANPNDTITRILFPGSTPQHKIFEGLDKLRHLEFLKHPVCSARSISPSTSAVTVTRSLSKTRQPEDKFKAKNLESAQKPIVEKKKVEAKASKTIKPTKQKTDTNQDAEAVSEESKIDGIKKIEERIFEKDEKIESITKEIQKIRQESTVQRIETDQIEEDVVKQTKKIVHRSKYDMRNVKSKVDSRAPSKSIDRKKVPEKKADAAGSPPITPKKTLVNGTAKPEKSRSLSRTNRSSPSATPGKSVKEANNRKVVEARVISRTSKAPTKGAKDTMPAQALVSTPAAVPSVPPNLPSSAKTERKPISRRPKTVSPAKPASLSPVRAAKQKLARPETDSAAKKIKGKVATELSKVVSAQAESTIIDETLMKTEVESVQVAQEAKTDIGDITEAEAVDMNNLTENKETDEEAVKEEEIEAPKEIEASIEIEIKEETQDEEEYLVVTKEEPVKIEDRDKEYDSLQEDIKTKDETEGENEIKKIHQDEEDSEKKRKMKDVDEDLRKEEELEKGIDEEPDESPKSPRKEIQKESFQRQTDQEETLDVKEPASKEQKEAESLPDEKFSTTIETSATTAPTLPEDEKIEEGEKDEADESDEADKDEEEKDEVEEMPAEVEVIKEEYPKKEIEDVGKEFEQVRPEQPITLPKTASIAPVESEPPQQKIHARDLVKTPDEVADLPVHEEVDPGIYSSGEFSRDLQKKLEEAELETDENIEPESSRPDYQALDKSEANILDEEEKDESEMKKLEKDMKDTEKKETELSEKIEEKQKDDGESLTNKYLDIIDQLERSTTQEMSSEPETTKLIKESKLQEVEEPLPDREEKASVDLTTESVPKESVPIIVEETVEPSSPVAEEGEEEEEDMKHLEGKAQTPLQHEEPIQATEQEPRKIISPLEETTPGKITPEISSPEKVTSEAELKDAMEIEAEKGSLSDSDRKTPPPSLEDEEKPVVESEKQIDSTTKLTVATEIQERSVDEQSTKDIQSEKVCTEVEDSKIKREESPEKETDTSEKPFVEKLPKDDALKNEESAPVKAESEATDSYLQERSSPHDSVKSGKVSPEEHGESVLGEISPKTLVRQTPDLQKPEEQIPEEKKKEEIQEKLSPKSSTTESPELIKPEKELPEEKEQEEVTDKASPRPSVAEMPEIPKSGKQSPEEKEKPTEKLSPKSSIRESPELIKPDKEMPEEKDNDETQEKISPKTPVPQTPELQKSGKETPEEKEQEEVTDKASPRPSVAESLEIPKSGKQSPEEKEEATEIDSPKTSIRESPEIIKTDNEMPEEKEKEEVTDKVSPRPSVAESLEIPKSGKQSPEEKEEATEKVSPKTSIRESPELIKTDNEMPEVKEKEEVTDKVSPRPSVAESLEIPKFGKQSPEEKEEATEKVSPKTSIRESPELIKTDNEMPEEKEQEEVTDKASPRPSVAEMPEIPKSGKQSPEEKEEPTEKLSPKSSIRESPELIKPDKEMPEEKDNDEIQEKISPKTPVPQTPELQKSGKETPEEKEQEEVTDKVSPRPSVAESLEIPKSGKQSPEEKEEATEIDSPKTSVRESPEPTKPGKQTPERALEEKEVDDKLLPESLAGQTPELQKCGEETLEEKRNVPEKASPETSVIESQEPEKSGKLTPEQISGEKEKKDVLDKVSPKTSAAESPELRKSGKQTPEEKEKKEIPQMVSPQTSTRETPELHESGKQMPEEKEKEDFSPKISAGESSVVKISDKQTHEEKEDVLDKVSPKTSVTESPKLKKIEKQALQESEKEVPDKLSPQTSTRQTPEFQKSDEQMPEEKDKIPDKVSSEASVIESPELQKSGKITPEMKEKEEAQDRVSPQTSTPETPEPQKSEKETPEEKENQDMIEKISPRPSVTQSPELQRSGKQTPEVKEEVPEAAGKPAPEKISPDQSTKVTPGTGSSSTSPVHSEGVHSGTVSPRKETLQPSEEVPDKTLIHKEMEEEKKLSPALSATESPFLKQDASSRTETPEISEKGQLEKEEKEKDTSRVSTPGRKASVASTAEGTGGMDASSRSTPISSEKDVSGNITPVSGKETPASEKDSLGRTTPDGGVTSSIGSPISCEEDGKAIPEISIAEDINKQSRLPEGVEVTSKEHAKSLLEKSSGKSTPLEAIKSSSAASSLPESPAPSSGIASPAHSMDRKGGSESEQISISGKSTPLDKKDSSLTNGIGGLDEELEKGILESEGHEKESQLTEELSSGEEEELKALEQGDDGDDSESEGSITRERLQSLAQVDTAPGSGCSSPGKKRDSGASSTNLEHIMQGSAESSPKGKKDDINNLVKSGGDTDNQAAVKRMLVTASSEDGGGEIEICPQGTIRLNKTGASPEPDVSLGKSDEERKEEVFGVEVSQGKKDYTTQKSIKLSSGSPEQDTSEEQEDDEAVQSQEFRSLIAQAQEEYKLQRSRKSSMNSPEGDNQDHSEIVRASVKTVSRTESSRMDENDPSIVITTILTEEREEQEDGMVKVTKTKEIITKGGKNEGTVVSIEEEKELKKRPEEDSKREEETGSKETSLCSTISQEDLVSRKDSCPRLEDLRRSSSEMSPLKTTYITSDSGDADGLATSSFYGREEEVLEYRREKGYESFTQIGPDGEKTEKTYFYTTDPEVSTSSGTFLKGIPESIPEAPEMTFDTFPTRDSFAPDDFAKAVDEHKMARGEYLGQPPAESQKAEKEQEKEKDVLEGWGKPLGLPLPPKNVRNAAILAGQNISTTSSLSTPSDNSDSITNWGHPMNLPSPVPPVTQNGNPEQKETPKKDKKTVQPKKNEKGSGNNTPSRRSESPVKQPERRAPSAGRSRPSSNSFLYLDLTYVPHHGNSYYSNVEFFKRVRARYYVFSGTEPSKEVYNALLEAKQTWEDKDLEVTIIPTYDTDILGYWVAENEEILAKNKIDLSPSASRCTINLQDHETSCSAYRLEF